MYAKLNAMPANPMSLSKDGQASVTWHVPECFPGGFPTYDDAKLTDLTELRKDPGASLMQVMWNTTQSLHASQALKSRPVRRKLLPCMGALRFLIDLMRDQGTDAGGTGCASDRLESMLVPGKIHPVDSC